MDLVGGVIFDYYGTLVEEAPEELESDREIFRSRGYELTEPIRRLWIDPVFDLEHASSSVDRRSYLDLQRELWRQALAASGIDSSDLDAMVDLAVDRHRSRRMVVLEGARETLATIKSAGIATAVCSNWGWDLPESVEKCELTDLIDVAITSAQVGFRKPHARIFELALEKLGLDASKALFVGDTWSTDIEGAVRAGLGAVLIVAPGDADVGEVGEGDSVLRITTLPELVPLLGLPPAAKLP